MAKYEIISSKKVCGHAPGSIVDDDDLQHGNVVHLLKSGHIAPAKAAKSAPKTAPKPDTDSQDSPEEN